MPKLLIGLFLLIAVGTIYQKMATASQNAAALVTIEAIHAIERVGKDDEAVSIETYQPYDESYGQLPPPPPLPYYQEEKVVQE